MNFPSISKEFTKTLPDQLFKIFLEYFGDRFTTKMSLREHHGKDESSYDPAPPDAVIFVKTTEEVIKVVKLCDEYSYPVIAFGSGTSLEGHILALSGGICIDFSQMNSIINFNSEDLTVTVQPGVTRKQLNNEIRNTGFFFPIDPGADASIGGMTATRASGTNAVLYGTMKENVLALKVISAKGNIIKTGTRAKKSSAGYDLTGLFVGSEGTLGIITEITLKVYPRPESVLSAICSFDMISQAVDTVIHIIQVGIPIARVEFVDENCVNAMNKYDNLNLPLKPLLLFEFHGTEANVNEQVELVKEISLENNANNFKWASLPEERTKLWQARHNAYFAMLQMRPGSRAITTDCCVPISRLTECIVETKKDCDSNDIVFGIVGHVGDGNFHVQMMVDTFDKNDVAKAEAVNQRMVKRAILMDGTCTGEHGVGIHKIDFLIEEHGENAINIMRVIKKSLDPKNILNPGKVIRI